jgi:hypothetical protein
MAVDAAAATGSLRTLGTGATQAAAGNHGHTGTLDANARVAVEKAGVAVGTRRTLNFIEGSNVTLTMADDAANEEVDITIDAAGGGGGSLSTLPGTFLAYRNAAQSLATGTWTKVQFNAEDRDASGWFDPTTNFRYTPQIAGIYQFFAAVYFQPGVANTTCQLKLYKNGASIGELDVATGSTALDEIRSGSFQAEANGTTDYFEVYAHHNAGVAKNIYGDATAERWTYFGGHLLANAGLIAPWTAVVKQAADVTNATTTNVNTDLVFTFEANSTYIVDLYLMATATLTTTGFAFAWDTSVAVTAANLTFEHQLAAAGTLTGGDAIADDTVRGLSSGVPVAAAITPMLGTGIIITGASAGTARLRFRPEVAASATFKAGSAMRVMKV